MSRRKGRYERRQERREEKRIQRCEEVGGLKEVFGYGDLYQAGKKCCNGVRWKNSVQRFELHLFSGTAKRRREVLTGKWKPKKCTHFTLRERGKVLVRIIFTIQPNGEILLLHAFIKRQSRDTMQALEQALNVLAQVRDRPELAAEYTVKEEKP